MTANSNKKIKYFKKTNLHEEKWKGRFGEAYTKRSPWNVKDMDKLYKMIFGVTLTELNCEFVKNIDRSSKILEVGCNVGVQLQFLQKMGFNNLYGIELNKNVVEISKSITKDINIIQGSVLDIPYKDEYFDLVFTSGVLIHISPKDINKAIKEIYRCSKKYIWGFEYYAENYTEIVYRGNKNMLWKGDFMKMYLESFDDLRLEKETKIKYLESDNYDKMFLLTK